MRKIPTLHFPIKLYIGPLLLFVSVLLFPLLARGIYTYLLDLARLCGIYVIIVCGLTMLMGYTGQVSLGHAGFYALGAYIPAVLVNSYGLSIPLAVFVGLISTSVISLIIGGSLLRLKGNHLALATLAVGIIIGEGVSKMDITGAADGLIGLPSLSLFGILDKPEISIMGLTIDGSIIKLYFVWLLTSLCVLWALQLVHSPGGRSLRAIRDDEMAAESLGINVYIMKVKVFVASCLLAGFAGAIYTFVHSEGYLGPDQFGLMMNVLLVMMVVMGGIGSIWGSVAGGIFLTALHEIINLAGSAMGAVDTSRFEHLIYGVLLIVILIISPDGLIPLIRKISLSIGNLIKTRLSAGAK